MSDFPFCLMYSERDGSLGPSTPSPSSSGWGRRGRRRPGSPRLFAFSVFAGSTSAIAIIFCGAELVLEDVVLALVDRLLGRLDAGAVLQDDDVRPGQARPSGRPRQGQDARERVRTDRHGTPPSARRKVRSRPMKYKQRFRRTRRRAHRHGPDRDPGRRRPCRRSRRADGAQGPPDSGGAADRDRDHREPGDASSRPRSRTSPGSSRSSRSPTPTSSSRASSTRRTPSSRSAASRSAGTRLAIIAGPCAVESLEQTVTIARAVKERGAHLLRGGAYKPRTSPYSFQGLGEEGLKILAAAREATRPPGRHRGPRHRLGRPRGAVRRLPPDRRAQHAELRAPEGRRGGSASRSS